jgi:hypothetical protein
MDITPRPDTTHHRITHRRRPIITGHDKHSLSPSPFARYGAELRRRRRELFARFFSYATALRVARSETVDILAVCADLVLHPDGLNPAIPVYLKRGRSGFAWGKEKAFDRRL